MTMRLPLALILAGICSSPSSGETEDAGLALSLGDVICYDYDSASQTCAIKSTVHRVQGLETDYAVHGRMSDGIDTIRLDIVVGDTAKDGRRCVRRDSINAALTPKDLPYARLLEIIVIGGMKQYALNDLCASYRKCGDDYIEQGWLKSERRPDWDSLVRHFPVDSPELADLTVRTMFFEDEFGDTPPTECLPAT